MTWSDQDLDALRDGALDSACVRALNAALLEDSALRSRWASLARSDARASAIFAGSTPMRRPATSRVALMAVLALAGVVAVSIRVNPSRPAAPLTGVEERTAAPEVLAGGPRLRVLAEYAAPRTSAPSRAGPATRSRHLHGG